MAALQILTEGMKEKQLPSPISVATGKKRQFSDKSHFELNIFKM
jgi:hypothetical protein